MTYGDMSLDAILRDWELSVKRKVRDFASDKPLFDGLARKVSHGDVNTGPLDGLEAEGPPLHVIRELKMRWAYPFHRHNCIAGSPWPIANF